MTAKLRIKYKILRLPVHICVYYGQLVFFQQLYEKMAYSGNRAELNVELQKPSELSPWYPSGG